MFRSILIFTELLNISIAYIIKGWFIKYIKLVYKIVLLLTNQSTNVSPPYYTPTFFDGGGEIFLHLLVNKRRIRKNARYTKFQDCPKMFAYI
jgi:hypothetical protein